jgi:hypothetical protein
LTASGEPSGLRRNSLLNRAEEEMDVQPNEPISSYQWLKNNHPSKIPAFGDLPLADKAGHSAVTVKEVTLGDPSAGETMVDGARVTVGVPLRDILIDVGGYRGYLPHPTTGEFLPVSLEEWRGRDPDSTLLQVVFTFKPAS